MGYGCLIWEHWVCLFFSLLGIFLGLLCRVSGSRCFVVSRRWSCGHESCSSRGG